MTMDSSSFRVRTAGLLSLTLLMCNTCQALVYRGPYGGSGGQNYNDCSSMYLRAGPITGLYVKEGPFINGISVRYGATWGPYHGGENGNLVLASFQPGEHVTMVSGTYDYQGLITSLNFTTTTSSYSFGSLSSNSFMADDPQGRYARCIYGASGLFLDSIGFGFGYLTETALLGEESAEPASLASFAD